MLFFTEHCDMAPGKGSQEHSRCSSPETTDHSFPVAVEAYGVFTNAPHDQQCVACLEIASSLPPVQLSDLGSLQQSVRQFAAGVFKILSRPNVRNTLSVMVFLQLLLLTPFAGCQEQGQFVMIVGLNCKVGLLFLPVFPSPSNTLIRR